MAELLLILLLIGGAGLFVAWPLLEAGDAQADGAPDHATLLARHRLALEALRDVEADHRAGSLDVDAYAAQRAEAEARAARTLAALESVRPAPTTSRSRPAAGGRRLGLGMGVALVALLLTGFALPAPVGLAERTETDVALAQAMASEQGRQARIDALLQRLGDDPNDADALSQLADAYLAGPSAEDRQRGAVALLALISLEPGNASAYRRLITAYIEAGDWTDAAAATDSLAEVVGDEDPDVPFFRGLVALRGDGDPAAAARHFERFLELAPDDPRAGMVQGLLAEARGEDGG